MTWTVTAADGIMSPKQEEILKHWLPDLNGNFHLSLFVFQLVSVSDEWHVCRRICETFLYYILDTTILYAAIPFV